MIRVGQTGYLDASMPGNDRLRTWSDIEQERDLLRQYAHEEGFKKAEEKGHELRPWSNINSSFCSKCGRQAKITEILSRYKTTFSGPAFDEECDDTTTYGSRDRWHWEYGGQME